MEILHFFLENLPYLTLTHCATTMLELLGKKIRRKPQPEQEERGVQEIQD